MSRYHVPGIAIGVLHDGDEDIAAYGVTNLEHPLPADADALFQIAGPTGKTYESAVRELLCIPLGTSTSCFNADEAITHRVAAGHSTVDEQPPVVRPYSFPRATTPVGGVISSVRDLLAYARFHLGDGRTPDGGRLLSVGSLELMRTRLAPADNDRGIGVAWFLREVGRVTVQQHGGSAIGQQGVLMLAPERGFAIAV